MMDAAPTKNRPALAERTNDEELPATKVAKRPATDISVATEGVVLEVDEETHDADLLTTGAADDSGRFADAMAYAGDYQNLAASLRTTGLRLEDVVEAALPHWNPDNKYAFGAALMRAVHDLHYLGVQTVAQLQQAATKPRPKRRRGPPRKGDRWSPRLQGQSPLSLTDEMDQAALERMKEAERKQGKEIQNMEPEEKGEPEEAKVESDVDDDDAEIEDAQDAVEVVAKTKKKPAAKKPAAKNPGTGRWTAEEHDEFLKCLDLYGNKWTKHAEHITTRTAAQINSHAQNYFSKTKAAGVRGGSGKYRNYADKIDPDLTAEVIPELQKHLKTLPGGEAMAEKVAGWGVFKDCPQGQGPRKNYVDLVANKSYRTRPEVVAALTAEASA